MSLDASVHAQTPAGRRYSIDGIVLGLFILGIVALTLGGLGGSFQPSRLIIILALLVMVLTRGTIVLIRGARAVYYTYGAIIVLGVLTLPLTSDIAAGLSLLVTVSLGMCSILLIRRRSTVASARRVRDAWAFALLITLPVACWEILTGTHYSFALQGRNVGGDFGSLPFASIFFGNFNNYSAFICLSYPMLLGALLERRRPTHQLVLLGGAALAVTVTLINTSRIAVAFVAFATAVAALFSLRGKISLALLSIGAIAAIRFSQFDVSYVQLRFAVDLLTGESTAQRIGLVRAGIEALSRSYGLGLGPGGFFTYAERYHPTLIPNPHNLLIEIAVNFTAVAAVLFVALLAAIFWWTLRNPDLPRSVRFPVLVTVPWIPFIGAINSLAVGYTYWWYWLATAVLIAVTTSGARDPDPRSGLAPTDRSPA